MSKNKDEFIEIDGIVTDKLPGSKFKVELENGSVVVCTICGKIRLSYIKIVPGDKVKVQLSPYDITMGRISWRYK